MNAVIAVLKKAENRNAEMLNARKGLRPTR
jgi:hypothetical protein